MADSSQYDEATQARRYAMAQKLLAGDKPPIRHWAEGLGNMAESLLGGYQLSKLDNERRAEKEQGKADLYATLGLPAPAAATAAPEGGFQKLAALLSGGSGSASAPAMAAPTAPDQTSYPTPPAAPPAPTTFRPGITAPAAAPVAPDASLPRGLRNNNPLNIEAGDFTKSQPGFVGSDGRFARFETPEQGTAAASKLLDTYESKYGLNTPAGIIGRWAPQGENNSAAYAATVAKKLGIGPNDPITPEMRPRLIAAMSEVENGRPAAVPQAAPPSAAPQVAAALTAPAGAPTDVSAAAKPPAVSTAPGLLSGVPDEKKAQIAQMLTSRNPTVKALGTQLMTQAMAASDLPKYEFKTAGDNIYRTNARTGTAEPIRDTGRGVKPMTPEQRKEWNVPEGMSAGIDDNGKPIFSPPGTNINLNTAQAGTKAMQAKAVEDFQAVQEASRSAVKRSPIWDQMEQASKGFTPGATAEMKLTAGRYLKDLGLSAGEGVPDAEVFKQLQQQIAIHAQPKGQGAVSNVERELFAKAIPNIAMSPEALQRSINISRSLDEYDRKAAQIYRDNAKKNGGIPDSIEVNQEIEKLGAPLSTADTSFLQKAGAGAEAAKPAVTPAKTPVQGQTATNPKTGEKIMLKDGQWVPVQ
jgi:hypothetical protein